MFSKENAIFVTVIIVSVGIVGALVVLNEPVQSDYKMDQPEYAVMIFPVSIRRADKYADEITIWMNTRAREGFAFVESRVNDNHATMIVMERR